MSRGLTYFVVGLSVIVIALLGVVMFLVVRDLFAVGSNTPVETAAPTEQAQAPTVAATASLPPPAVEVLPTLTPLPTVTPTETPPATETPLPTDTPLPTNTATQVPVVIVPTNPPPAPTNTPVPQPPPPDTRGLSATYFGLTDDSDFRVDKRVWFEFTIVNGTGGNVSYNKLGVLPKKGGQDRYDWFQQSYGGPNASIKPDGLVHKDNIRLPESGNYTLRLAICFDGWEACNSGGGSWVTMSQEIPISIN